MKEYLLFLFKLLAGYKRQTILLAILAVVAAIFDTTAPLILGRSLDAAHVSTGPYIWIWLLALWFIVRIVAERCRNYVATEGAAIGDEAGQAELLKAIGILLEKPLPFHYDSKSHEMTENLSRFRWEISNVMRGAIFDLLPALITGFAILVYIFTVDARIGSVLLLALVLFLKYTYDKSNDRKDIRRAWYETSSKALSPGWDALKNILIIKSTTNEKLVREKINSGGDEFVRTNRAITVYDYAFQNNQNLIVAIATLLVLFISIHNLTTGRFTFGQVTAMNSYAVIVLGYIRYVQWTYRSLSEGVTLHGKVKDIVAVPSEDYSNGAQIEIKGDVRFEHVAFRYLDEKPVLSDVSFEVKAGQRVAVVGESGEGKSTIVDLLGRYYTPKSGIISVDGVPISNINILSLRSQMAYVPQDLSLLHESIKDNIRFGRSGATDEEVVDAAKKAHLHEFIIGLPKGYDTLVGERGLKLSGGQRQRVALARAFLRNPKILILDEPTSNLDSKTEGIIQESLETLMKGKTTFVIAHRLRTIAEADQILVLKDGVIAESGTHAELQKKNGAYAALRKAQELADTEKSA